MGPQEEGKRGSYLSARAFQKISHGPWPHQIANPKSARGKREQGPNGRPFFKDVNIRIPGIIFVQDRPSFLGGGIYIYIDWAFKYPGRKKYIDYYFILVPFK